MPSQRCCIPDHLKQYSPWENRAPSGISSSNTAAQISSAAQRKGRYVAESTAHPASMLPAVAAYAITNYSRPGDLVLDPLCGIGTTLVEACGCRLVIHGGNLRHRWTQAVGHDRKSCRYDCCI